MVICGSGVRLQSAYAKYGKENFTKKILKLFDSRKEASDYERQMVNEELIRRNECYNCTLGGDAFDMTNMVVALDSSDGKKKHIPKEEYDANPQRYVRSYQADS